MYPSNLQTEFGYDSPYWTNNETYAVEDGLEGLTEKQTKLASYWNTPFNKMCLGMRVNGKTNWVSFDYKASSLYSVIKDGTFKSTNLGNEAWRSLIDGSALQENCNREGFNVVAKHNFSTVHIKIRIGLEANNENHCYSSDSSIGFGMLVRGCYKDVRSTTCGNIAAVCIGQNKDTATFGYILVQ